MKYVINTEFGGFYVPEDVRAMIPCSMYAVDYDGDIRTNPILIDWVENHPEDSALAVVDIPDNATDWRLINYDGVEDMLVVIDGKMQYIL